MSDRRLLSLLCLGAIASMSPFLGAGCGGDDTADPSGAGGSADSSGAGGKGGASSGGSAGSSDHAGASSTGGSTTVDAAADRTESGQVGGGGNGSGGGSGSDGGASRCQELVAKCTLIDPGTGAIHACVATGMQGNAAACETSFAGCKQSCGVALCQRIGTICHDKEETCHEMGHAGIAEPCFDRALECFDLCK